MPNTHNSQAARWRFGRSRGIALVVILILLMAITTVVAFSAKHAVVGESSARNQIDYEVARQAAEAALRDGEKDALGEISDDSSRCKRNVENRFTAIYFTPVCHLGQCSESKGVHTWEKNSATAEPWWPESYGGKWLRIHANDAFDFYGSVPIGGCTGVFPGSMPVIGVQHQPEYLLEYLNKDIPVVRVTARGFGITGYETQVVLQSYVRLP